MGSSLSRPEAVNTASRSPVLSEKDVNELSQSLKTCTVAAPLSEDGSITLKNVENWEGKIAKDPKIQLSRTILVDTDFKTALASRYAKVADPHVFNLQLDFKTDPITSQKSSGRCWLFATTNVLRYSVMQKLDLKEFQLSQSYLFMWDKLNKSNYFLESMIETADKPLDDRLVSHLMSDLISDGGQWDMAVNLLETYGVVPQSIYPESFSSSSSSGLNTLLKLKLRELALDLRKHISALRSQPDMVEAKILQSVRGKKEELMSQVWTIMTTTLGVPPRPDERFTWDYYDKDDKPKSWSGTPIEFYKAFASQKFSPSDSFSLINDPRNAYKTLITVDKLGNIWGGRPVLYVNTEIDDLKNAVVKMLKAGHPVFFGCDVGQFSDRVGGFMDTALHQYENAFNITLGLTKAERLQVGESQMTHAMVISGVHIETETGKPVRYKVENSWGPDVGEKGYFVMSDAWFDEFVYQVVVPKALAPKELVKVFEKGEKVVLPPWDPMGSLA